MVKRHIFHLSVPVDDLAAAERFYTRVLGAVIGRRADAWIDALIWGHQITLQLRPDEVLPREGQGKRHFGVVLPWDDWERIADRLSRLGIIFLSPPALLQAGTRDEQAKLHLEDPAHNVIEIKSYRNPRTTLGCGDPAYEVTDA